MNARHRIALVLVGALAYGLFLALTAPAPVVWSWVQDRVPAQVYGPAGSIWSGTAEAVVNGPLRLDAVRWELHPSSLLTLSPTVQASADLPVGSGSGEIEFGSGGDLTLRDVRARTDTDTVLTWIQRAPLIPLAAGNVDLILTEGVIRDGLLDRGDGLLTWENAAVGPEGRFALGNIALRLRPGDPVGTRGALTARDGPLAVDGTLKLAPDGEFRLQAQVRPDDPDDPEARRLAGLFGITDPAGTTFIATGNVDGRDLSLRQQAD